MTVMKCPPMPSLKYQREACHLCGAVTELDAETMCRPSSDPTGERYCGADFHQGFAVAPTTDSVLALDAWCDAHHDCDEEGCVAMLVRDTSDALGQVLGAALKRSTPEKT